MTTRDWVIRTARIDDQARVHELMRRATRDESASDAKAGARWQWLFLNNSADSRLMYLVADAGDRLAGQYALLPVRMQHRGAAIKGLLSLDTATDPQFARRGIFTTLARSLFDATRDEFPLVFGFPNQQSAPGFFRKLEWIHLRPYPLLMRPIGSLAHAARVKHPALAPAAKVADLLLVPLLRLYDRARSFATDSGDLQLRPFDRFGDWADTMWRANSERFGTCAVRDQAFLNWRYCQSPYLYQRILAEDYRAVRGFAVVTKSTWNGLPLPYLMELMTTDPSDAVAATALLAHVIRLATKDGALAVATMATRSNPHRRRMMLSGFLPVPERVMPHRVFGVRANGPGIEADSCLNIDDWYLSGSDLDFM